MRLVKRDSIILAFSNSRWFGTTGLVRSGCIANYAVLREITSKNVEHSPQKVNDCDIPENFFREKS